MQERRKDMAKHKHINPNVKAIAEYLNSPRSWDCNLNELLIEEIDWSDINPNTIVPKLEMRKFVKAIDDKEIRLDVIRFLHEYTDTYFNEGAEAIVREEFKARGYGATNDVIRLEAAHKIKNLRDELDAQIKQIKSAGEYTGDKFKTLTKRIEELEEQVWQLSNQNKDLAIQLDKYKHPSQYGKHIPEELLKLGVYNMLLYLESVKVVRSVTEPNSRGMHQITCFQWDASKALFGYFVGKVNDAVGLRGARVPYNWKIFEPIINNYNELIDEARKSLSAINNSSSKQAIRLEGVEKIDEALNHREFPF